MGIDLQLSHIDGHTEWQTHRKELNSYLHVPAASCHPRSVYASTIRGEVCRLLRTNSSKTNLIKHLRFFKEARNERSFLHGCVAFHTTLFAKWPKKDSRNQEAKEVLYVHQVQPFSSQPCNQQLLEEAR